MAKSRKSTKKCSRGQIAVKSHMHGSKKVKSICRKSPKKHRKHSRKGSKKHHSKKHHSKK